MMSFRFDTADDLSGFAIDFHEPGLDAVRDIVRLRADPEVADRCDRNREGFAEIIPLAQVTAFEIEPLDAAILAIGDVDDALAIYGQAMRQPELARTRSGASPLTHALPVRAVFEDTRVSVSIGNEDALVRTEGNVGRAAKRSG